jgi:hypothetical protein
LDQANLYAKAFDNVLSNELLEEMYNAFNPNSPYWKEHYYSDGSITTPSPYFSYLSNIDEKMLNSKNLIDIFTMHLFKIVGEAYP